MGYLQQAQQTDNNQPAYHHRNWALYYWANAEIDEAQSYFDQAFQLSNSTVDLLELHYAEFLKSQAQLEQARIYLQQAINKGEPEALARRDSF